MTHENQQGWQLWVFYTISKPALRHRTHVREFVQEVECSFLDSNGVKPLAHSVPPGSTHSVQGLELLAADKLDNSPQNILGKITLQKLKTLCQDPKCYLPTSTGHQYRNIYRSENMELNRHLSKEGRIDLDQHIPARRQGELEVRQPRIKAAGNGPLQVRRRLRRSPQAEALPNVCPKHGRDCCWPSKTSDLRVFACNPNIVTMPFFGGPLR